MREKKRILFRKELPQLTPMMDHRYFQRYLEDQCKAGLSSEKAGNLLLGRDCPIARFLREECEFVDPVTGLKDIKVTEKGERKKYRWPQWAQVFYYRRPTGSSPFEEEPTYQRCLDRIRICEKTGAHGFGDEDGEYTA